jgi:peptidoglycan/LPS O-acetylase OafA/YrhL
MFPVEINGPLWSIGYEVFSYVALAFFLFLWFLIPGKRTWMRGFTWWLVVWIAMVGVHALFLAYGQTDSFQKGWQFGLSGGGKYWWPTYNPVGFFATFLFGVLAAGVSQELGRRRKDERGSWGADIVVFGTLAAWVFLLWELRHEGDYALSWPLHPYYFPTFDLMIALVLAFSPHTRLMGRLLDNPPARFVATISFGLYIWHYVLIAAVGWLWRPDLERSAIRNPADWALLFTAIYGVATLLAAASWYWFEKPIVAWSQKKKRPAQERAPSGRE